MLPQGDGSILFAYPFKSIDPRVSIQGFLSKTLFKNQIREDEKETSTGWNRYSVEPRRPK